MTIMKKHHFGWAGASLLALTGLWAPAASQAALVTGDATFTINNTAFLAANSYQVYLEKHWGPGDNSLDITRNTTGGTTYGQSDIATTLFPVNTNTVTATLTAPCPSCTPKTYGRTQQATTMDAGDTSVGQIGLSGAWRLNSPYGVLTPYDFSLVKNAGTWVIRTYDSAYSYQDFLTLANVSESLDNQGRLSLTGDLKWANALWPTMAGGNTSAVFGSFSLQPAAVPLPAAVWLFGTALAGLIGVVGRRSASAS
ncbi:VPLPA-CTERM sorting domain-containing protein [Methylococcus sp. EFPC2]|uniref:VPLPA-CTERM sorting domain-containing protein n=1 Tax=Methylococcus sp. EFPC2 TaxID=2812648 RepID=UPI0019685CFB|nr:VPLPA-CTERM sorting domain-containing protein [Methylococcus sp. EFPC2]QSA97245.1 VPLPA-CTERM sorting domain-containing protein [Methylococcus sp. EFPC2]